MSTLQRRVDIDHPIDTASSSSVTVFPRDPKNGRLCLALYTGCAAIHLRPTPATARDLIAALQWALLDDGEATTGCAA